MKLPTLPGQLNEPIIKGLLIGLGALLVVCCGVGVVVAAVNQVVNPTPARSSTTTPAPRPSSTPAGTVAPTTAATVSATPSSSTAQQSTQPITPPTIAPPTTTSPPPPAATDPRFGTCAEAKQHGYGPYYRGIDPEYYWYIDRDNDGIVCE